MKDVTVRTINKYQTEVIIDSKRVVLTDMNKVNAAKTRRKLVDRIINTLLVLAFSIVFTWFIWIFLTHDEGHYEPDCIKDGVLYDTDQDGDYYHWVDPN